MSLVTETTAVADAPSPRLPSRSAGSGAVAPQDRVTVIGPKSPWAIFDLREVWQYRDLLLALAERDTKLRYRQTALGPIWVLLQPLIASGVFAVVFGKIAKLSSGSIPYFLFAYVGALGWNAFQVTLNRSSGSLVSNAHLVAKVYFPRLILPLSTLLTALIDLGVSLGLLAILLLVNHIPFGTGLLLIPVWLLLFMTLGLGVGLITGSLMVTYRDIGQIQGVLIQFGQYATPVGFSVAQILERTSQKFAILFTINPLTYLIEGLRWSVFGNLSGGAPSPAGVAYAAIMSVLILFFGMALFGREERRFADVI